MESTALLKHTELAESVHPANVPIKHVVKPGSSVSQFKHKFDTVSASGATVVWKPPGGANSLISRQLFIQYDVTGITDANYLNHAFRSYPLNNCITNCTVKINGQGSVSSQPRDVVRVFERMHDDAQFRARYKSMFPSQLDYANHYDQMLKLKAIQNRDTEDHADDLTADVTAHWLPLYVVDSPFNTTSWKSGKAEQNRAVFPYKVDAATGARTYTIMEPLMHPLFMTGTDEALTNVRELTIELTFSGFDRMLSTPDGANIALAITQENTFLVGFSEQPSISIPPTVKIGLPMYEVRIESIPNKGGAAASFEQPTSTHYLNQVPSKIYLACLRSRDAADPRLVSSAQGLNITKVNLNLNGQSGFLSQMDRAGLYQMSAMNGVSGLNFPQWADLCFSLVVIDMARDVGRFQPGALGNFSVQINYTAEGHIMTGWNRGAAQAAAAFETVLIFEYDAELTLSASDVNTQSGVTQSELASAEGAAEQGVIALNPSTFNGSGMHGGKFNVGSFFRGLRDGVHTTANIANRGAQVADMLGLKAPPRVQAALAGLNVVDQASRGFGGSSLTYG